MYVQRQTGLGTGLCLPVQRCTQQRGRAFCRPDSGYYQHPTAAPVEVEELEAKGGLEGPLDGGSRTGSCARYWQASVPMRAR